MSPTVGDLRSLPEERYVPFVDILGFRSLVERMFSGEPQLFAGTLNALEELKQSEEFSEQTESQLTAFSDSIVISVSRREGLPVLSAHLMFLVGSLLKQGVFCIGGVAIGRTHHADGILLGEGLIKAYDLERQEAKTPRIILEHPLAEHLWFDIMPLPVWERDVDGYLYLNVLSQFTQHSDDEDMVARLEADMRAVLDVAVFQQLREVLSHALRYHVEAPASHDIIAKYEWLANDFNRVVTRFLPGRVEPIPVDGIYDPDAS